jgi:hypothetical protein
MAYDCRVYRILIASPSDVEEEREIAVRVIQEWNDLYSYSRKVALLPLRWETHTAPEYGTRPQEVINRAIVDECDLLLGIFWTRIGSPTGIAESGTLEEIERVGNAGKPIMLYFSRVEIDPDRIDLDQIEKLKQFKEKTYPKGLVESYKKIIEFRDKFAKQLELKIRDLQRSDASGELPLSLQFLSIENGELIGKSLNHVFDHPNVSNFDVVPREEHERLKPFAKTAVKARSYFPVVLAIENSSPSGIRNLYVELEVSATSDSVEISETKPGLLKWYRFYDKHLTMTDQPWSNIFREEDSERVERNLAKFDANKLQRIDRGWRLSFEWEALQPQRIRLIKPVLYVYSPVSTKLSIRAKMFADSFPEPFMLEANVSIEAKQNFIDLTDLLPNWKKLLAEDDPAKK